MRAFTRITATTVLAAGVTVFGVGTAFADPPEEVTESAEGAADTVEGAAESADDLSPEAQALLEDPQVQEILTDEEAVELLSDAESLEVLRSLLELEDPLGALEELDLPVATDDLPAGTGDATDQLPADGVDTGGVTEPVDGATGGLGLR